MSAKSAAERALKRIEKERDHYLGRANAHGRERNRGIAEAYEHAAQIIREEIAKGDK